MARMKSSTVYIPFIRIVLIKRPLFEGWSKSTTPALKHSGFDTQTIIAASLAIPVSLTLTVGGIVSVWAMYRKISNNYLTDIASGELRTALHEMQASITSFRESLIQSAKLADENHVLVTKELKNLYAITQQHSTNIDTILLQLNNLAVSIDDSSTKLTILEEKVSTLSALTSTDAINAGEKLKTIVTTSAAVASGNLPSSVFPTKTIITAGGVKRSLSLATLVTDVNKPSSTLSDITIFNDTASIQAKQNSTFLKSLLPGNNINRLLHKELFTTAIPKDTCYTINLIDFIGLDKNQYDVLAKSEPIVQKQFFDKWWSQALRECKMKVFRVDTSGFSTLNTDTADGKAVVDETIVYRIVLQPMINTTTSTTGAYSDIMASTISSSVPLTTASVINEFFVAVPKNAVNFQSSLIVFTSGTATTVMENELLGKFFNTLSIQADKNQSFNLFSMGVKGAAATTLVSGTAFLAYKTLKMTNPVESAQLISNPTVIEVCKSIMKVVKQVIF